MRATVQKSGFDVFISYRREGAGAEALLIKAKLEGDKFRVFVDVTNLDKGIFDVALLKRIEETRNFLVLLSPNALDPCVDPGDWLRREIACAIRSKRNIIPILLPNFKFPAELPEDIQELPRHSGVVYSNVYFESTAKRIEEMMPRASRSFWTRPLFLPVTLALTIALATGITGYLRLKSHNNPPPLQASQLELSLQQDANLLRLSGRFDEAIGKDQAIVSLRGALASAASEDIARMKNLREQERSLLDDGNAAERRNDLARAKTDYEQVMDLHGEHELDAIDSFNVVTQKMSGRTDADIAKTNFANGVTAFNHSEYSVAKAYFDQVLARTPSNWPQRSQAKDYLRRSTNRAQQQQHFIQAQNFFTAKNYEAARNEAKQAIDTLDPDQRFVQQAQELVARIPPAPALPPAQPSADAEIQSLMHDAQSLVQQGQFKEAWNKAASIERLKGDASTLRGAIRTSEETRYQELNSRYVTANKQNLAELQDVLSAFQRFSLNAVSREVDAKKYVDQIASEIAALPAERTALLPQPSAGVATASSREDVQAVLDRYVLAVANGDLNAVKAVRQLNTEEEKTMVNSLHAVKGKGFSFRDCITPEIAGDSAQTSCMMAVTKDKNTPPVHVTIFLNRTNGRWMIVRIH